MVLVQEWPVFHFFLGNIGQENVFYDIIQQKKLLSRLQKPKLPKEAKIDIFPKGLTHGFNQKMAFFQPFLFSAIQFRKMSFTIFQNGKTTFYTIKTRSSRSREIHIFSKGLTHGFGPIMVIFLSLFFLGNIGHENVFYDILERKNAFLGYKIKKFKKSKKFDIFPKGLTHGFGTKTGIFRTFLLSKIGQENVSLRYSSKKKRFSRL